MSSWWSPTPDSGTINSVRLTVDVLAPQDVPVIVVLNRFEPDRELHVKKSGLVA